MLAILTGWHELEHGVAVRLGDEILYPGVLGCLEVRPRGRGDADVSFEDGPSLAGGDFPDGVLTRVAPAGQAHSPGRAGVVHPGHGPVGRDQPSPPVALDRTTGLVRGRPVLRPWVVSREDRGTRPVRTSALMIVFSRWRVRPGRYCRAGREAWPPRACLLASPFACPWPGVVGGLHQRGRVRDVICNFNADGFSSLYPKYKGGRPPRFTLAQRREIKKIAKSHPTWYRTPDRRGQ